MATNALRAIRRLDFRRRIHALIDQAEKYAVLCDFPKKVEFRFCAFLAGWESTARHDSKASRWFEIWQEHCRKRHHGKEGRTLADPVKAVSLSERWQVGQEEESKAYKRVRHGLHDVLRITLNHYCPGDGKDLSLQGSDEPTVLLEKIRIIQIWKRAWKSPRPGGFLIDLDRIVRGVSRAKRKPCSRAKLGSPKFTADGWAARRKRELLRTWLQRRSV